MKYKFKKSSKLNKFYLIGYILLLNIFPSGYGFAQNMGAINAMHNQHTQNFFMQMTQQNAIRATMARNATALINRKSNYRVVLTSGVNLVLQSKMEFDKTGKAYLVLEDKSKMKNDSLRTQIILPHMTQSITQLSGNFQDIISGNPADSCWLFKTITGPVNAYSFLPETYNLHIGYLKMLQKGNGELVPLNEINLNTLLADDKQALFLVEDKKYFEALKLYNKNHKKKAKHKELSHR